MGIRKVGAILSIFGKQMVEVSLYVDEHTRKLV
jgi:hypothetical protein